MDHDLRALRTRMDDLKLKRDGMRAELAVLTEKPEPTDGDALRAERLLKGFEHAEAELAELERDYHAASVEAVRAAASNPANVEEGFHAVDHRVTRRRQDPLAGLGGDLQAADTEAGLAARARTFLEQPDEQLPDHAKEVLVGLVDRSGALGSAFVLAATAPAYRSAFAKALQSEHGYRLWDAEELLAVQRVEAVRSSMSLTAANGGLLLPTSLDPTVVLTNSGMVNPIRRLARVVTIASDQYNGVSSAGVTASWTAENTAIGDASPTFTAVTVPVHKLAAYVTASYEIFQDADLLAQLPVLFGDAFDRAEGAAFVTGSGSGAPKGIITCLSGSAATITCTTRGAFTSASSVDVFAMDNALPARARNKGASWIMNRATINTIRQMSAASGQNFWSNSAAEQTPARLLDHALYESSDVTATTTSGSKLAVLGSFSDMVVVDRAGTVVEFMQNAVDSSGVPTGTRGWVAWRRSGCNVDNVDSFRILNT